MMLVPSPTFTISITMCDQKTNTQTMLKLACNCLNGRISFAQNCTTALVTSCLSAAVTCLNSGQCRHSGKVGQFPEAASAKLVTLAGLQMCF